MIQTTIIPESTTVQITIPKNYVGKKVFALFYIEDEITPNEDTLSLQKPSDFFGTLSKEEGQKMHSHIEESRKEWKRDI